MPKQVSKIDGDGFYVEPVIVKANEELSDDLIAKPVPPGLFSPKWNGSAWVEGLPADEVKSRAAQALAQRGTDTSIEEKVLALEAQLNQIQLDLEEIKSKMQAGG
jgi:hypothetical protein